jgi:hypothetical protein
MAAAICAVALLLLLLQQTALCSGYSESSLALPFSIRWGSARRAWRRHRAPLASKTSVLLTEPIANRGHDHDEVLAGLLDFVQEKGFAAPIRMHVTGDGSVRVSSDAANMVCVCVCVCVCV